MFLQKAIKRIGTCLKSTKDKEIICNFDSTKVIEVYVDADFSGSWTLADSRDLRSTLSRTSCIIEVANCPTC